MPSLDKSELHSLVLESIGSDVVQNSGIDSDPPFEVNLEDEEPTRCRFYLFTLTATGSEHRSKDEYRIDLRLPNHEGGDVSPAAPDRSGDSLILLGGYNPEREVFAFWDDDLYESYSWVRHLQVKEETLDEAEAKGVGFQHRNGGSGGETVIAAKKESLRRAIRMRYRLEQTRDLLSEYLPDDWRSISSNNESMRIHRFELFADYFFTQTEQTHTIPARCNRAEELSHPITSHILEQIGLSDRSALYDVLSKVGHDWLGEPTSQDIEAERDSVEEQITSEPTLTEEEEEFNKTQRRARDSAFTEAVRDAYDERCAVCGSKRVSPAGNPEVEAAHIYPKSMNGRDHVQNGIALCKLHHWAFDCGWISLSDDYEILVKDESGLDGYDEFSPLEEDRIRLPEEDDKRPHPKFLAEHRQMNGFDS
ncbi:HNH endonuclease [Natrinema sp. 74]|uniref:HNH endonuclease n=1 Tax=Natrinema sp. 74 TaxID=3384159 RepID=UPI0038D4591C